MGVPGFLLWFLKKHKDIKFLFDNLDNKDVPIENFEALMIDANCLLHPMCFKVLADNPDISNQNKLEEPLLSNWEKGWDEDEYNKKHTEKGYYILDKLIKDNIELCDILVTKNNVIYFIHVKNGFNTQMRNLYIQVILSAKRLWNDLYNNTGSSYLIETIKKYNKLNKNNKIDKNTFTKYNQVFENEIGFIPNLSILDAIFALGPMARKLID